jgi:hypothetical protein
MCTILQEVPSSAKMHIAKGTTYTHVTSDASYKSEVTQQILLYVFPAEDESVPTGVVPSFCQSRN